MGYIIRINNFINKLEDYLNGLKSRYKSNMEYYKEGTKELEKKESYSTEINRLKLELLLVDIQIGVKQQGGKN